jgi:hypothetical protein
MSTTLPAQRLPIVVPLVSPASLYDSITVNGRVLDFSGATLKFSMRPYASRAPSINGATAIPIVPPDLSGNNARYDWSPSTLVEGEAFGWWTFILPGSLTQDTPEFPILISDHGPGLGTQTGAIVDGAQMYLPVTFQYLQKDSRFGDRAMQQNAELIKLKVLGYTMPPDQEAQIELVLLDFLSKRVALELITPGIDFWSRQLRTSTSTQTSEVSSFPDMIASLKDLRVSLANQLADDWRYVQLLDPSVPNRRVVPMPQSSLGGPDDPWSGRHVTRDPQSMPRLHTGYVPWSFGSLGAYPFP